MTDKIRWLVIGVICAAIVVMSMLSWLMWNNTREVRDGNRAVVCMLAAPIEEREIVVHKCLTDNGL